MVGFNTKVFQGKRVFLTGDTGFKGAWMAQWLHMLGAEVFGYARPEKTSNDLFALLGLREKIDHTDGELCNPADLQAAMKRARPEIVIHMAAQALVRHSYDDPVETYQSNVMGSVHLLEAVRACNADIRALVYVTSDKCYQNNEWIYGYREEDRMGGKDPYSASKAAAELVFASYRHSFLDMFTHMGCATARAGNVIGGGDWAKDRIVPDSIAALDQGKPISVRNPGSTRPWQHVIEPVSGYLHLAASLLEDPQKYSGAWNFGPNNTSNNTVRALTDEILRTWGEGEVEYMPEADAPPEAGLLLLNCDKANLLLGWRPQWEFSTSVQMTVDWYKRVLSGESATAVTTDHISNYEKGL